MGKYLKLDIENGFTEIEAEEILLKDLQKHVEGYIEVVSNMFLPSKESYKNIILLVNEEGKYLDKGFTPTMYVKTNEKEDFFVGEDILVGPVLFLGRNEDDFTFLTDEEIRLIKQDVQKNGAIRESNGKISRVYIFV